MNLLIEGCYMKKMFSVLIFSLLAWCGQAQADLQEVDWQLAGDKAISKDLQTGLGWLDLTVTKGLSYATVQQQLLDGFYQGFRMATYVEVLQLFTNLSGTDVTGATLQTQVNVASDPLLLDQYGATLSNGHVGKLGSTQTLGPSRIARGFYLGSDGLIYQATALQRTAAGSDVWHILSGSAYTYTVNIYSSSYDATTALSFSGVYLVKDLNLTDVNAPALGSLLTLMMMLVGLRRRVGG